MSLTQLHYIVAVDKFRHCGTAANNRFVTPQTLSMQIQKLEDEFLLLEEGHCFCDRALKLCNSSEREISNKTKKALFESGYLDKFKN